MIAPDRVLLPDLDAWKLKALAAEVAALDAQAQLVATKHRAAVEAYRAQWTTLAVAHGFDPDSAYRLDVEAATLIRATPGAMEVLP